MPVDGGLSLDSFAELGQVTVTDMFFVLDGNEAAGTPGGSVSIEGGEVLVNNTWIFSSGYGEQDGGAITIRGRDVTVTADRERFETDQSIGLAGAERTPTLIFTEAFGAGRGGDIVLSGESLTIQAGVGIFACNFGTGPSGDVILAAHDLTIRFSTSIGTDSFGSGPGGDTIVTAENLLISGDDAVRFTGIFTDTLGTGTGGDVLVTASNIELLDGGFIGAFNDGSTGPGGDVVIIADSILVDEPERRAEDLFRPTTIESTALFTPGDGGNVVIVANDLTVRGLADIAAATVASEGNAGTIFIDVNTLEVLEGGSITSATVDGGSGGAVMIEADHVVIANETAQFFSIIDAVSTPGFTGGNTPLDPAGDAGSVALDVGTLELRPGGVILTSSLATGNAGNITISADRVSVNGDGTAFVIGDRLSERREPSNFTGILSDAASIAGGDAGSISITADAIEVGGGALVATTTAGPGTGGTITLNGGTVQITGSSRVDASTSGRGPSGSISITGGAVTIEGNGSGLFTESTSEASDAGTAGFISVNAGNLRVRDAALISTQSALADGGDITLDIGESGLIRRAAVTTSVGAGEGGGGNIAITSGVLALDQGTIQANAFGGPGGNILIVTDSLIASPDSVIEASSQLGVSGTISIESPDVDLTSSVTLLPSTLADVAAQLAAQCEARGGKTLASFVGVGRGALPVQPSGGHLAYYLADQATTGEAKNAASPVGGLAFAPITLKIECVS